MKEINFNQETVIAMHSLTEHLTACSKFAAEEKRKLFCWLLNHHAELSLQEHIHAEYPEGMPFGWFVELVIEDQVNIIKQALSRDLTKEKVTASVTIEFDIDAEKLAEKSIDAGSLLDYIQATDDDTVDGFNINPAVPRCDVTSDFFLSNARIVDRKFVLHEN